MPALLLAFAVAALAPPPPGCRRATSGPNTTLYECILCMSTDPQLIPNVNYYLNAECSFDAPVPGVVPHPATVVVETNTTIQPLDSNVYVVLHGAINIAGDNVKLSDFSVSNKIQVVSRQAQNLEISNVIVTQDAVGLATAPSDLTHDVNVNGLKISALMVPNRQQSTIAALYHAVGNMDITCTPGNNDRVVIQPMLPVGTAKFSDCQVINMTAIFDAYGSAFLYDMYPTKLPDWVYQMRQWALTLTVASIVLLLLRYDSHSKKIKASKPKRTTQFSATPPAYNAAPAVTMKFGGFL